jgi:uncharacterized SAM-binding protein YcdF (DUF218 family)
MITPFPWILEALVFPPGNVLLFGIVALFFRGGTRRLVFAAVFVLLYLQSAPAIVDALTAPLERYPPLSLDHLPAADAIVVLAGGRYRAAPEYGRDTVSVLTLARLQYAADLERATGLPLVVSGGSAQGESDAEAALMEQVLRSTFGIDTEILKETKSRNTAENALYTKELLDARSWHRVLLVTHARHMLRSVAMFEQMGVAVIPAPLRFVTRSVDGPVVLLDWLPSAKSMYQLRDACHEYVGLLWYRVRY